MRNLSDTWIHQTCWWVTRTLSPHPTTRTIDTLCPKITLESLTLKPLLREGLNVGSLPTSVWQIPCFRNCRLRNLSEIQGTQIPRWPLFGSVRACARSTVQAVPVSARTAPDGKDLGRDVCRTKLPSKKLYSMLERVWKTRKKDPKRVRNVFCLSSVA